MRISDWSSDVCSSDIPGNIAQHASRAALSLKRGMPIRPYMSSGIQETLLACADSNIGGVILFAPRLRESGLADYEWLLVLMLIGSGVGVALFCVDLQSSRKIGRAND